MPENPFEKRWDEILKEDNIEELIKTHTDEHKAFVQLVQRRIENLQYQRRANVLEVGCGTAIDSYYLAEHTNASIWAIDISSKAIQLAEEIGKHFNCKVNLKVGDATKTDFKDGFFDVIFSQGTIEHFRDPVPVMNEQVRILCNGGYLIIDVPQKYNIYTIFRKLLSMMERWPYGWERSYSIFELRKLGTQIGLKVVKLFTSALTCELAKSKRPYIAVLGKLYNYIMKIIYRLSHRFSVYFLQDICVIFIKEKD